MAKSNETCNYFEYEITFADSARKTNTIRCSKPFGAVGNYFMFTLLNGHEKLMVSGHILSIECMDYPRGSSNIVGLDGVTPADAPRQPFSLS